VLTLERLKALMAYDPETGLFTRLDLRGGATAQPSTLDDMGYVRVCIDYKRFRLHRLAVFYMTGAMPTGHVDHINGVRHDNRWSNLRVVSHRTNIENRKGPNANSKTGLLGVHFSRSDNKFKAQITVNYKFVSLGRFDTAEEASKAYMAARRRLHQGNTL
jgi:hypothetical protein